MPVLSVDESFTKPASMLYRNMLAMETEEVIRSHPLDGVVLMGGCDKTTPGLVMGAISAGVPMIFLPAGPMLRGNYAGKVLGSGSDAWKYWDERRAGNITDEEWLGIQGGIARSAGTCMTMGTAATMMSVTAIACRNAAVVAMATGCSTNAVVHLIAIARRAGVNLTLDDLDALGRTTPLIANIRPSGEHYLMQDFYYAGGLRALMKQLQDRLDGSAITVTGMPLSETLSGARVYSDDVIRPLSNPVWIV
jgi:dihydroxyacid dehydratase/phosphogluconate dehydratase